ncbi:MAG TPA: hypothetical protein PLH94_09105 [Fimbriimonadaceae bacterium]|nr:hypothetical protein [Fimbriimonadaceae bacterium]
MKRLFWLIALVTLLAGCQNAKGEDANAVPPKDASPQAESKGSGSGGVAPTNPAAGGLSPVTGSESVTGSGSGVGQAAKDKARQVGGGTSADKMPADDQ